VGDIQTPPPQVPRDRWGRPLVIPPGGGKPVAYRRCTRYIAVLDDRYNLERWKQRQVAAGMAGRSDLVVQAASAAGDKSVLDKVVDAAMEAAGASVGATTGTALHAITEQRDRGQQPTVPDAHRADLVAYEQATADMQMCDIEVFVVNDDHRVGGTFDRVVEMDGRRYVADLKTGSIEHGWGEIEMQLAMYASSSRYSPATGRREPLHVEPDWGLVIHLPAGQGVCAIWWANLAEGRAGLEVCRRVWGWRDKRHRPARQMIPLTEQIAGANSVETLTYLWERHHQVWTDAHTAAAVARKQELLAQGA
jgi:hypothetical protein